MYFIDLIKLNRGSMTVKIYKFLFIHICFMMCANVFAISNNGLAAFSPSLIQLSLTAKEKKSAPSKLVIIEPSALYTPNFYDINEFKPLFDSASYIKHKIENPVEVKNKDMEMTFMPHILLTDMVSTFKVSIELKAIFL
jgi:hypothetical protein